ncbi:MAG: hypothetical protein H6983_07825 [Ectothiorhodospiraceae bacterium]|nr:hypothetical protein [Chromatiales bacterium]MCP5154055.1 hypothetical protein [Ectothiorhodospiraceae bacterium]
MSLHSTSTSLVTAAPGAPPPEHAADDFEAAFVPPGGALVPVLPVDAWRERLANHLDHRVARAPRDLGAHARRVLNHLERDDAAAVLAALLDLDAVCAGKGRALREHLLRKASRVLDAAGTRLLVARLDHAGGHVAAAADICPRARLATRPASGPALVIRGQGLPVEMVTDPLERADALIDGGRLVEACDELEVAVAEEPDRDDINQRLVEVYRRLGDGARFARMRARLEGLAIGAPGTWEDAAAHFARSASEAS